jgi:hypothetical protein
MNMPESYWAQTARQGDLLSLQRDIGPDLPNSANLGPMPNDLRRKTPQIFLKKLVSELGLGKLG